MAIKNANQLSVEVKFVTNNKYPLAKVYNRHLLNPENRGCNLVFIHSDAVISDFLFLEKLERGLEEFDIVGVAGCIPPYDLSRSMHLAQHGSSGEQVRLHPDVQAEGIRGEVQ